MPMPKDPIKRELWRQRQSEAQKKNPPRYWLGKKQPKEATAKRRAQLMGRRLSPATEFKKGLIPWNKGKTKKEFPQLSNSGVPKDKYTGKNSPSWQGGLSFELYGLEFNNKLKEQIRERGLYICQLCSSPQNGRKLDVHHIDYNKKNNKISNLIPLCLQCHRFTNHDREYWTNYFQEKILIKEMR